MALNFPNSPTNGQLYTDTLSGNSWTWDSANTCWKSTSTYIQTITVSSSAPGTPAVGQLWWNRDYGRLLVYYNDGNTSQWVDASPSDYTSTLAYTVANAAFGKANTALQNTSGTFAGDLFITGNVGIGTASPQYKLDVQNNANSLARFMFSNSNTNQWQQTDLAIGRGNTANFLYIGTNYQNIQQSFIDDRGGTYLSFKNQGTETMRIDGSGRVTKPLQPLFKAYTTGFSKTGGSWEKITGLSTVTYNIGSHYDSSTTKFTAPIAGNYMFLCGGWSSSSANGDRYAFNFRVNGGGQTFISGSNYCLVDSPLIQHTEIIPLSASDYVELAGFSASSTTWGGTSHVFWFSGYLIG